MNPTRRHLVAAAAAATLGLPTIARAQGRTLRILVGFPPGGGTDAIARLLGEALRAELGATVVVENRAGAGGQLAAQALKAAAPDGNTVFISHDHTISILPLVSKTPGFDPAKDFVPVGGFASFVNAFAVSPGTPAKTMDEYVAWVRGSGGGKGTVGVPAPASTPEFLVKVLGGRYQLDLVPVPYRGSAPMMGDMLGNQIAAGVGSVPDFIENHRAGRLRVLAVLGRARQAALPEVPSFGEMGLTGFDDLPYYGFWAPAGTPAAAVDGFAQALARAANRPEVRERLGQLGLAVDVMSPPQLAAREQAYTRNWAEIIRRSGFQPQ
ncbi:MAG: Bug family tripartite tricarboxylate transporter substrate binding protein [Burkholderiaceae bacterium]|jgi:tripartite-type tricarboxylate transporter receptor subunit TctC|nr:Bug family tripartite tricarboxylate transporter substrate binding protein [Burkholderiaceae bacterium]MCZ8175757.1 Bug family tripartite tricarboxylate transporter substrate binding protein [Burkholderiaceae bacterium]